MQSGLNFRKVYGSILLLLITSVVGMIGFRLIEGYSWLDSAYMTVITMSTVGFGTLGDLTVGGKLFSIFLIIISAGIFVYAITTISTFVIEGEFQHFFKRYQVNKQIEKLSEHIIICGLGRNGREVARELESQQVPYLIVEENEEVIQDFLEHHPEALILQGDATHDDVLEDANIDKARGLITALATDAENVFITLTAREMNPRIKIVARASQESSVSKLRRAGANEVILPNLIGGRKMANVLTRPALVEFLEMVSGDSRINKLHLEVVSCEAHDALIGKTLAELDLRRQTGVLVLGRKSGNLPVELNPGPHRQLESSDRLFMIGTNEQIA
ncbi:MAG: potassium channel protein, partial [Bacteroidota bacterium]